MSVFMGVPTMYSYLLQQYDSMPEAQQQRARQAATALRLTVSGSSACPTPIMDRWKQLTGSHLLERCGRKCGLSGTKVGVVCCWCCCCRPALISLSLASLYVPGAAAMPSYLHHRLHLGPLPSHLKPLSHPFPPRTPTSVHTYPHFPAGMA